MDEAVQERAGRDHEGIARDRVAVLQRESGDAPLVDENPAGLADNPGDARLRVERRAHPGAVTAFVGLRARRPHGRTTAGVEQLELDAGRVDRETHQTAHRVDLADEMPLRGPADGRIAWHVRDGVVRERTDGDVESHPRRRPRGFDARVPRPDHDDLVMPHVNT